MLLLRPIRLTSKFCGVQRCSFSVAPWDVRWLDTSRLRSHPSPSTSNARKKWLVHRVHAELALLDHQQHQHHAVENNSETDNNLIDYGLLLRECAASLQQSKDANNEGVLQFAAKILKEMRYVCEVTPSTSALVGLGKVVLKGLAERDANDNKKTVENLNAAEEKIVEMMKNVGVDPKVGEEALLILHADGGNLSRMDELYQSLKNRSGGNPLGMETCAALIRAYSISNPPRVEEAISLWKDVAERMGQKSAGPHSAVNAGITAVLKALEKGGDIGGKKSEIAKGIMESYRKENDGRLLPVPACNSLLRTFLNSGDAATGLKDAETLLLEMRNADMVADISAINTILKVYSTSTPPATDKAQLLFLQCEKKGVKLNRTSRVHLLNAYASMEPPLVQTAESLLQELVAQDHNAGNRSEHSETETSTTDPSVTATTPYNTMLLAYSRSVPPCADKAIALLEMMRSPYSLVKPDAESLRLVIKALVNAKQSNRAKQLLRQAVKVEGQEAVALARQEIPKVEEDDGEIEQQQQQQQQQGEALPFSELWSSARLMHLTKESKNKEANNEVSATTESILASFKPSPPPQPPAGSPARSKQHVAQLKSELGKIVSDASKDSVPMNWERTREVVTDLIKAKEKLPAKTCNYIMLEFGKRPELQAELRQFYEFLVKSNVRFYKKTLATLGYEDQTEQQSEEDDHE